MSANYTQVIRPGAQIGTVPEGPLAGWAVVAAGNNGMIAVGRHCWGHLDESRHSVSVDEAWAAWSAYWADQS